MIIIIYIIFYYLLYKSKTYPQHARSYHRQSLNDDSTRALEMPNFRGYPQDFENKIKGLRRLSTSWKWM